MQLFLDEFAHRQATKGKRLLMVWDGAPAHRATTLQISELISLMSVPAYTPELNPSERVWPLVKEGVANRAHDDSILLLIYCLYPSTSSRDPSIFHVLNELYKV